ncbi:hypothetical protein BJ085DRAFT_30758 [Dimargaris cristalligena]|uniref:Uncharacterized protein n=1 Tax=Dimargaris cristalligena TaxID=215637 RepID=A0A4Q0A0W4_9FUNG|nr:hypothetical protein BJ085DRAFT_30758 [Dimargaris cristalligena]|eukprot:RKP39703.1 hypothetical protein BJ085DRAFT_30758 [Dimargaris cristalligena]
MASEGEGTSVHLLDYLLYECTTIYTQTCRNQDSALAADQANYSRLVAAGAGPAVRLQVCQRLNFLIQDLSTQLKALPTFKPTPTFRLRLLLCRLANQLLGYFYSFESQPGSLATALSRFTLGHIPGYLLPDHFLNRALTNHPAGAPPTRPYLRTAFTSFLVVSELACNIAKLNPDCVQPMNPIDSFWYQAFLDFQTQLAIDAAMLGNESPVQCIKSAFTMEVEKHICLWTPSDTYHDYLNARETRLAR